MNSQMRLSLDPAIFLRFAVLAAVCSTLLGGCASVAKTPSQMKESNQARREACFQHSKEEVAQFVKVKLETCREQSFSAGPLMNTDIWAESTVLEDGTQQVSLIQKANWNKFYMQMVEVQETADCPAYVVVYGMKDNEGWFAQSDQMINWIKAWNAEC